MNKILVSGKPNILITGGAGFIGSHLSDALVKENHIIVIDNFVTGSEKNIDHLLQNPNFEFIKHDLTEPFDLIKFPELRKFKVELQGVQEIYHLACPTSPKEYNKYPIETLMTNSYATWNVLEIAKQFKSKFLFLSSSSIYGDLDAGQPIKEDNWGHVNPIGPRSCYNEGKRFAESLIMNYHQKLEVDTKIARVFNTYGPRMKIDDGRMIPDQIVAAINNKDLIIYGDEQSTGSYCYIQDLIEALTRLIKSDLHMPVNLGSVEKHKLQDVARFIARLTGSKSEIKFEKAPEYSAKQQLIPDISLAKQEIDWFPIITLNEGLQKTIEDMKVKVREYDSRMSS